MIVGDQEHANASIVMKPVVTNLPWLFFIGPFLCMYLCLLLMIVGEIDVIEAHIVCLTLCILLQCIGLVLSLIFFTILIFHKHRLLIISRMNILSATVFLLRCFTMIVTSLSVPGSHLECRAGQYKSYQVCAKCALWGKRERERERERERLRRGGRSASDVVTINGHHCAIWVCQIFSLPWNAFRRFRGQGQRYVPLIMPLLPAFSTKPITMVIWAVWHGMVHSQVSNKCSASRQGVRFQFFHAVFQHCTDSTPKGHYSLTVFQF